jgi:broad specificity phosphatase PhoE
MIFLVRHAESKANIGLPTSDPATIGITENGKYQSAKFAEEIKIAPDLIVTSRYVRTLQTAQPLIEKYPQANLETWSIHEFTYLSPSHV